jgi:high-affinity nickel permease
MSTTLLGALATASVLGLTHAIEPDHVAGISSLTSEYRDSRLSAMVGVCFSLGHVLLVVVWLAVAYLLVDSVTFDPVFATAGTVGVGVVLGLLGALMVVGGLRTIFQSDEHEHYGVTHTNLHFHLPRLPGSVRAEPNHAHEHGHGVTAYLKTGIVGALFTLSPPVSMIAFSSTLLSTSGPTVVWLAVVTYAIAIIAAMGLVGAGTGVLFDLTHERGATVYGVVQVVGGVAIAVLAGSLLIDTVPVILL